MLFSGEFSAQRKKLNLTQEEVAIKIRVSRTYVTLIESGKRLPGKKHLLKIAEALGVKKHEVINWYLDDVRDQLT